MNMYTMAVSILVPMIVFTFVAAIILIPRTLRTMERVRMHETLRRLHENGEPLPDGVLDALNGRGPAPEILTTLNSPMAELRRGVILICVALAMVCLSFAIDLGSRDYQVIWPLTGAAAFPGLIGVGSLIMFFLGSKARV
ncbi:hypothetical protein BH11PSE2_BH11PSE2_04910 [soil metagenome]